MRFFQRIRASRRTKLADAPPLALLRAHKTGSRSFRRAASKWYGVPESSGPSFGSLITEGTLREHRFLAPHMTLQSWLDLAGPDRGWVVAVTLREPRARLRSAFSYFKAYPDDHPTRSGLLLKGMNYMDFLRSEEPDLCAMKENVLSRFLGGGRFGPPPFGRNKVYLPEGYSAEACRETALERVRSENVIPLVLEHAPRSLALLGKRLGATRLPEMPWVNRTPSPAALDHLSSDLEDASVADDLEVYKAALARLGQLSSG